MSREVLFEAPDISVYQGDVNFKQLKESGYKQVYLRAGYGKNNVDQNYVKNATACLNLDIKVMIYWFSYALNVEMAAKEAEYAIAQAKKYWSKCPIAFDLEYDTRRWAATQGINIDKKMATDMAIAFLKVVVAEGYIPVLYLNNDYRKNYLDVELIRGEIPGLQLWYARYGEATDAELSDVGIWQYTSKGSILGIAGVVDLNKVFEDVFECVAAENPACQNTMNLYILGFQQTANADGYVDQDGNPLEEDGKDGRCTQYVRRQINMEAKYGHFTGTKGEVVRWWKQRLNDILGLDMEVNDLFDEDAHIATIEFQKKFNLAVDGIAGYNTIQMAFYN